MFSERRQEYCRAGLKNLLNQTFVHLKSRTIVKAKYEKSAQKIPNPKEMPRQLRSRLTMASLMFLLVLSVPPFQIRLILQLSIINSQRSMDIWSFKTQGINYDKYRPEYPTELRSDALEPLNKKQSYLDIAVGTGKIILSFCQNFKSIKGIDISEQMLSVSQQGVDRFKEHNPQKSIVLEKNSITDLNSTEKYDLITCGQALHFFTGENTYLKIKDMLNEGGMFMVFGYVLREVHSDDPLENSYFYQFYDQMLPYFTFDMYELHNHYTKEERYPFKKVFEKIDRKQTDLVVQWSREEYINYLKTWSAYNLYMSKHGVDPITGLEAKGSKKVTCVFDYFRIRCYK